MTRTRELTSCGIDPRDGSQCTACWSVLQRCSRVRLASVIRGRTGRKPGRAIFSWWIRWRRRRVLDCRCGHAIPRAYPRDGETHRPAARRTNPHRGAGPPQRNPHQSPHAGRSLPRLRATDVSPRAAATSASDGQLPALDRPADHRSPPAHPQPLMVPAEPPQSAPPPAGSRTSISPSTSLGESRPKRSALIRGRNGRHPVRRTELPRSIR